ncbi:MAG: DoxX family protein [Alphaproteobacteria bacterium]
MAAPYDRSKLFIPAMAGLYSALSCAAWPLVRATTGLFAMPHGAQKLFGLFGGDIGATIQFFEQIGLHPATALAYLVGATEFFGGLFLVLGLFTRVAAAGIAILMLIAAFQVHLANGYFWTDGGYEYPLFWAVIALAVFIRGAGPASLDRAIGKEF